MSESLIDGVNAVANPEFTRRVASQLGEPTANVTRGLQGGMAAMLSGLLAKTGDAGAVQGVFNLVTTGANDGSVLDNPAALLDANAATSSVNALGAQFLTNVFGDRTQAVTDLLSKHSGLRRSVVSTLLRIGAPAVLAVLGRRVRQDGLDLGGFTKMMSTERDRITRAEPAGLEVALGTAVSVPPASVEARERGEHIVDAYTVPTETRRRSRVAPVLAVAAALALLFAIWPRGNKGGSEQSRQATAGGEVMSPLPPVTPAPPAIPGVTLPGGTVIVVDPNSPEARIIGFLKGSNPADASTWFVLDHMQFETNSAKLSAESSEQVDNLVRILKSFPNTRVRIGGFTDNSGSESANLKLSRERASSVKRALIDAGIPASRVQAQGFGSKNPIADNSTDEGRAQNRRISLLVTKK